MNDFKFEIKDYYDMLNLHKALLEAKFHQNPDNNYIAGSPVIAKIYNELVDLLTNYDLQNKGKEDWTEWRKLCNQNYYKERIIEGIKRFGGWEVLDFNEKRDRVLNYASPFTCTENDIAMLIYEIDHMDEEL